MANECVELYVHVLPPFELRSSSRSLFAPFELRSSSRSLFAPFELRPSSFSSVFRLFDYFAALLGERMCDLPYF